MIEIINRELCKPRKPPVSLYHSQLDCSGIGHMPHEWRIPLKNPEITRPYETLLSESSVEKRLIQPFSPRIPLAVRQFCFSPS